MKNGFNLGPELHNEAKLCRAAGLVGEPPNTSRLEPFINQWSSSKHTVIWRPHQPGRNTGTGRIHGLVILGEREDSWSGYSGPERIHGLLIVAQTGQMDCYTGPVVKWTGYTQTFVAISLSSVTCVITTYFYSFFQHWVWNRIPHTNHKIVNALSSF